MVGNLYPQLPDVLLPWYEANRRDLPWRQDRDPYHIWLSEIMLQQTRVEAVKGYYARFLQTLPTIANLASADDEQLHKLWEGLGYYSRVRNLKKAAQVVMQKYNGVFPRKYEEVLALPGIGEYTAGAICSIAFNQPTPAVDGNVLRVVSRLNNDNTPIDNPTYKSQVNKALAAIYPACADDFTQALMELGATVCGPNRKPDCENCPCNSICLAFKNGTAEELPVKTPKKDRRIEDKTVFILNCDGLYALEKRPNKGLLAGLWQFPNTQGRLPVEEAICFLEQKRIKISEIKRTVERKHIFTHIEWHMSGVYIEVRNINEAYTWLSAEQIREETALPTAFRQFFEELDNV